MIQRLKDWFKAKFDQWRINRYLKRRHVKKLDHPVALRRSFLQPQKALEILYQALNGSLSTVGIMGFNHATKKFVPAFNEDQLTTVMVTMADLIPALPEDKQEEVKSLLKGLRQHNWGYVRAAANIAVNTFEPREEQAASCSYRTECGN